MQFGIIQLVIMAAGLMFMLQRKQAGVALLLVAIYVAFRDAMVLAMFRAG
jgi:hypothetical protein